MRSLLAGHVADMILIAHRTMIGMDFAISDASVLPHGKDSALGVSHRVVLALAFTLPGGVHRFPFNRISSLRGGAPL